MYASFKLAHIELVTFSIEVQLVWLQPQVQG